MNAIIDGLQNGLVFQYLLLGADGRADDGRNFFFHVPGKFIQCEPLYGPGRETMFGKLVILTIAAEAFERFDDFIPRIGRAIEDHKSAATGAGYFSTHCACFLCTVVNVFNTAIGYIVRHQSFLLESEIEDLSYLIQPVLSAMPPSSFLPALSVAAWLRWIAHSFRLHFVVFLNDRCGFTAG